MVYDLVDVIISKDVIILRDPCVLAGSLLCYVLEIKEGKAWGTLVLDLCGSSMQISLWRH